MRAFVAWFSLFVVYNNAASASDACYGGNVVIARPGDTSRTRYSYGVSAPFGSRLPLHRPEPLPVVLAEPADACQASRASREEYKGSILLAKRGNCAFTHKATAAQAFGAAALLIYDAEPGCLVIGFNESLPSRLNISIPVAGVASETGRLLTEYAGKGGEIQCWSPRKAKLDPAAGLIWVLAVSTVGIAAVWAGRDYTQGRHVVQDGSSLRNRRGPATEAEETLEVQMVSGIGAVAFVGVASSMLVLLYFFLNHIFALVLVALFSFASLQALSVVFSTWLGKAFPELKARKVDFGRAIGEVSYHSLLALPPAAIWIAAWFILDPKTWGWISQDGMGVALMLLVLRQFMLPNLKIASLLLLLCFFYDIFWVFLQPLLTKGPSVMVEVAMGGSTHETMPMLLQVPSLWGPPYSTSILGYGDIVLPGLLIVFARIWDAAFQKPLYKSYFAPLLIGYGTGLALTFAALVLRVGGSQGQPALLYLIPCTLGIAFLLALQRGEFWSMWRGLEAELKRLRSGPVAALEVAEEGSSESESLLSLRGSNAD